MTIFLNLLLGFVPALILGASISAGVEDDAGHRRVFLLVYGLWALTLAGWNWITRAHMAWVFVWAAVGVAVLVAWGTRRPKA